MVYRDIENQIILDVKTRTVETCSGDIWKCTQCGWEYGSRGGINFYHTKRRCQSIKERYGFWRPLKPSQLTDKDGEGK